MNEHLNVHLNSEEISQMVAGERLWPNRQIHLESCPQCAAELGEARAQLAGFRQSVRAAAEHPEVFWGRQRYVIGCRISDAQLWRHRWLRPVWLATATAAAAAIVFVFALALGVVNVHRIAPAITQTAQISAQSDSDDLLLADVQAELQRDVPAALEPAHLLMERVPQASAQRAVRRVLKVNSSSPTVREF